MDYRRIEKLVTAVGFGFTPPIWHSHVKFASLPVVHITELRASHPFVFAWLHDVGDSLEFVCKIPSGAYRASRMPI